MITYKNLYAKIYDFDNLFFAYQKARKGKTRCAYVIEFEKNLERNLLDLQFELQTQTYTPSQLQTFILRDPKTRKISKADFRDRVVHHALVNIIEPVFDKGFIYDSYANRKGKGTFKAIQRFDYVKMPSENYTLQCVVGILNIQKTNKPHTLVCGKTQSFFDFKRKVSRNNTRNCFVLKADIKHYFEEVEHEILLEIIQRKIKDKSVIWLIKQIIANVPELNSGGRAAKRNASWEFDIAILCKCLSQQTRLFC